MITMTETFLFLAATSTPAPDVNIDLQIGAIVLGIVAVTAILAATIAKVMMTRAREKTRREIAAYAAEGMIDPDKAIEMIRAGRSYEESMGDLYDKRAQAEIKAQKAAAKAEKKAAKSNLSD